MWYKDKVVRLFVGKVEMTETIRTLYNEDFAFKEFVDVKLQLYSTGDFGDLAEMRATMQHEEIRQSVEHGDFIYRFGIHYVLPQRAFFGYYKLPERIREAVNYRGYTMDAILIRTDVEPESEIHLVTTRISEA